MAQRLRFQARTLATVLSEMQAEVPQVNAVGLDATGFYMDMDEGYSATEKDLSFLSGYCQAQNHCEVQE